ncbi:NACHT domain-containing NTPase [Nostoc sp. TCL26-01]|uniref:NACHT domain-containing protein n=1 Tax=Nostoc sp. TCL26-01 TaxID=2576904 RepID=UPI0015B97D9F|nr:NACHT domain-containing NTPase [Nostoc sp. TCL26-01]QLE55633.1 NACHT domain-containing NTPase [Nostoc sp. TCL26-01]
MAKRSLQASAQGIKKAKQAFKRKGWTQEYLASEVGLETRQPIWKFFSGKPVDRHVFNDICSALELEASEIVQPFVFDESITLDLLEEHATLDIDGLVEKLRAIHHHKIQAQCGTLHLLDITRPVAVNDIYIEVNVCEDIANQKWLDINELQKLNSHDHHSSIFTQLSSQQLGGLAAVAKYEKMILLGKPGSGKTTFLQSVALSCNQGIFLGNYLPIFINLKSFADDARDYHQLSLCKYIHEYLMDSSISELELMMILHQGRALILLDGLDKIIGSNQEKILNKIRSFIDKFYKNRLVITCRTGANHSKFYGFTELEIADFNKLQIAEFTHKWFSLVAKNSPDEAQIIVYQFMQKLEIAENSEILQLATTPLLLNLICLFWQSVRDFPPNHWEIYKQSLDLLLVRWDEVRGMKFSQVTPDLSLLHKIKLLSHIAIISFYQQHYWFTETQIKQIIADYLCSLPNANTDLDALELESGAVLQMMEMQHGLLVEKAKGIYAFSHLIFQEYFTAREIVTNTNHQNLKDLTNHLNDKPWRKVFLLSAAMLKPADALFKLMKAAIDHMVIKNAKLSKFLQWVEQKSAQVKSECCCASVRAFYLTTALPPDNPLAGNQDLAIALDHQFTSKLSGDLALDLALIHALMVSLTITADIFFLRLSTLNLALDLKHLLVNEVFLHQSLQHLQYQLPSPTQSRENLRIWWQANGQTWTEELRTVLINTRQIGYDWQFHQQDCQDLQQYWDANKLLLDCLLVANDLSPSLRSHLEMSIVKFSHQNSADTNS